MSETKMVKVGRKNVRRLPLAEWWAWLESELAWEMAWKRNAWMKRELDEFKTMCNNCPKADLDEIAPNEL